MPSPSRLGAALQQAAQPSQMKSRLEQAIAESSAASWNFDDDSSDEEADQAAEAILAEHRARREAQLAREAEEKAAAEEAASEVASYVGHEHLGFAAKLAAMKKAQQRLAHAKATKLQAVAHARLLAERAKVTICAQVLTDVDTLSILLLTFEDLFVGDVPTEGGLQQYTALASVCSQWRSAINDVMRRRCVLRHACMFVDGPRTVHGFVRPSFLQMTPSDELLVADNHRVTLLPKPDIPYADETPPFARVDGPRAALCTLGNGDGTGGDKPGELYHPHGVALLVEDTSRIWVSDRSNHRIQCLRTRDGAPLSATPRGLVDGPYDIALHTPARGGVMLFVSDANNNRVLGLNARAMDTPPMVTMPRESLADLSEKGQLDRPRGLSLDADELVVAELGNNRLSVFRLSTGDFVRTIGDEPSQNGAMPLRQPFGVHHAHGLLLVSEFAPIGRLCVFTPYGAPLQVLVPRGCGGLGGITSCPSWIYVLDSDKGHILSFATRRPAELGSQPRRPMRSIKSQMDAAEKAAAKVRAVAAAEVPQVTHGVVDAIEAFRFASLKAVAAAEKEANEKAASEKAASAEDGDSGEGTCAAGSASSSGGRLLAAWVADNPEDPTPDYTEKKMLAKRSGLSIKEVTEWFRNRKVNVAQAAADKATADANAAAEKLAKMSVEEKTRAMAIKLAESLGGFSSEPGYRQMSVNMCEY